MKTRTISICAILAAMAVILVTVLHFPIFPVAPFLEYDPADIPIFVGTFLFGPTVGLITTLIACVIQGVSVSAGSGVIGMLMHFVATGSFVLVSGLLHKKLKSNGGLIFSAAIGVLVWLVMMVIWNLIMTPLFMGTPRDAVLKIMLPVIVPFNLIKAGINSALAVILCLTIKPHLKRLLGQKYEENARLALSKKAKTLEPPEYNEGNTI